VSNIDYLAPVINAQKCIICVQTAQMILTSALWVGELVTLYRMENIYVYDNSNSFELKICAAPYEVNPFVTTGTYMSHLQRVFSSSLG